MLKNQVHRDLLIFTIGGMLGLVGIYFVIKKSKKVSNKAVKLADEEWRKWGEQSMNQFGRVVKEGSKEYDKGFAERVGDYWREALGLLYNGNNRDVAWSSAFISWLWKKAGAGDDFKYSASHSNYIYDSVLKRWDGKTKAPFVAYRSSEAVPDIGDMVAYSRQDQNDLYALPAPYKSHVDLVVDKGDGYIDVIGGNVAQGVTKRRLRTDNQGFIADTKNKWFAVIKTNI